MVAEKYAIAKYLDEIIGRNQKEKQRGHDADAVGLSWVDIKEM